MPGDLSISIQVIELECNWEESGGGKGRWVFPASLPSQVHLGGVGGAGGTNGPTQGVEGAWALSTGVVNLGSHSGRGHRLTAKFVHSAVEGLGFLGVPVSEVLNIYRSEVSQDSDKAWEVQLQTPGGWGEAGNGAGAVVAVAPPLPQSLTSPDKLSPPPPHPRAHPSGKKLSIMRSPRGFTASAPISCRSTRLESQSLRGGGAKTEHGQGGDGVREAEVRDQKASSGSPEVALLILVKRSEPVVEAEQTGLRDCGGGGGR